MRLKLTGGDRDPLGSVMAISEMWSATVLAIILAAAPHGGVAQTRSGPDTVWVADGCATGRALRVEVLLADTVIYRTSVTICRRQRSQIPQTHWPFSFKPSTRLVWSNDSTGPDESVSGDIWQAGGEPDALLLGVSLQSHNRILVNGLHVASAYQISRTPVDDDLVVRTTPLPPRGKGPRRGS